MDIATDGEGAGMISASHCPVEWVGGLAAPGRKIDQDIDLAT